MMQLHEKIKQARLSAGLTEKELAEKIGVSRTTYSYWETKTPSVKNIKLVAKALNLAEDYFFGDLNGKKLIEVDNPYEVLINKATRNDAYLRVILMAVGELLAAHRNEPIIKVIGELLKAVEVEQRDQLK